MQDLVRSDSFITAPETVYELKKIYHLVLCFRRALADLETDTSSRTMLQITMIYPIPA
jgi:hypothetical protein